MTHQQLVIVGEPGAGKSVLMLLLTLDLLDLRNPDEPVPVLLAISSWNPDSEHLHSWAVRRLLEDYRFFAGDRDLVESMVAAGQIMLVLDGLDEIPAKLRASAIDGIDRASVDRPVVVTCRSVDYATTVRTGANLPAATVIEIEPVDLSDAASFLAATPLAAARWTPVFDGLRTAPDTPLAAVLSSPLMVSLARTTYTDPATSPSELLDQGRFPDACAIERRLLNGFIHSAYALDDAAGGRRRPVADTLRWLTFLADRLIALDTKDIAWWNLPGATARLVAGLLAGAGLGLLVGFLCGTGVALAVGAVTGLGVGFELGRMPMLAAGSAAGLLAGAASQWSGGYGGGLAADLGYGIPVGIAGGFGIGLAVALQLVLTGASRRPSPAVVRFRIRGRLRRFFQMIAMGLASGTVFGFLVQRGPEVEVALVFAGGGAAGLALGLVGGLSVWLATPADAQGASSPRSILRMDRHAAFAQAVAFGVVGGLADGVVVGLVHGPERGAVGAVVGFLASFVLALAASASGRYSIALVWLVLCRKLPWRVMAFLDDAHQRGVLRRLGGIHQFRHDQLKQHLAERRYADNRLR